MSYIKIKKTSNKITINDYDVYNILLKIPKGRVATYGSIAKALGNPKASRLVGKIVGMNPNPIKVPCHRVVMSSGKIGGYAYGVEKKINLLKEEGISITENNFVNNFDEVKFIPKFISELK